MEKINLPPYYVGQKVLYIKKWTNCPFVIYPPKDIKVILSASNFSFFDEWHFQIKGYEKDSEGGEQWFPWDDFVTIEEQPMPLLTFEKIKESEKTRQEPEHLILN